MKRSLGQLFGKKFLSIMSSNLEYLHMQPHVPQSHIKTHLRNCTSLAPSSAGTLAVVERVPGRQKVRVSLCTQTELSGGSLRFRLFSVHNDSGYHPWRLHPQPTEPLRKFILMTHQVERHGQQVTETIWG